MSMDDRGNGHEEEAPVTSRSSQAPESNWRDGPASTRSIQRGLLEIDGLLAASLQRQGQDGATIDRVESVLRGMTPTLGRVDRELEMVRDHVFTLTADARHMSQAIDGMEQKLENLKHGQEAIGRSVEFIVGDVRGAIEGMKTVVATKGEVADIRIIAEANRERINRVENRADETGRHVGIVLHKRNDALEAEESDRKRTVRQVAVSLLLLIVGALIQYVSGGGH